MAAVTFVTVFTFKVPTAHLLQIMVKLIHWSGLNGSYNRFFSNHFSQVRNKHTIFKQRGLRLLSQSGQN